MGISHEELTANTAAHGHQGKSCCQPIRPEGLLCWVGALCTSGWWHCKSCIHSQKIEIVLVSEQPGSLAALVKGICLTWAAELVT